MYEINEIQMQDGTKLLIKEMPDGIIDIYLTHASIGIVPIASNHIQIKKFNTDVPKRTIEKLRKEGIIK